MTKLFKPHKVLLATGDKTGTFIGMALNMLSIDKNLNLHTVSDLFSELSWGIYYNDPEINDQYDDFDIIKRDDEARDPAISVERICEGFENIIQSKQIFFGLASFEVNAFEAPIFDDISLSEQKLDVLMEAHKQARQIGFPTIQKGNHIQCEFKGNLKKWMSFQDPKKFSRIAAEITQKDISLFGIAATSQAAATFFILRTLDGEDRKGSVDERTFEVLMKGIRNKQIAPVSWFKLDLGLKSIETLEHWDHIKENPDFQKIKRKYAQYLRDNFKPNKEMGKLSNLNLEDLTEEDVAKYKDDLKGAMLRLNKMLKD